MARIELNDIYVRYPVYQSSRQRSILGFAANRASFGQIARDAGKIPMVDAVNGLSLSMRDGDRVALVGANGSGKTTLLKVCAGLILPDRGTALIEGSRACIINPGAGLDTEKTGAENVVAIGKLLGVPKARLPALLQDIAEFTELGDFLNLPVRTYSSGMTVRLLFALATSVERDILVVDEMIGAGDAHFVEKAANRVRLMFARAKILILATHMGEIAESWCTRAVWLHSGRQIMTGDAAAVWDAYKHNRRPVEAAA